VVTAASEQERAQAAQLSQRVQEVSMGQVKIAFADQDYTEEAAQAEAEERIELCVVKVEGAKRGFVLLPRRWMVERSFVWTSRFRRLARDYERLVETLQGWHWLAFSILLTAKIVELLQLAD